MIPGYGPSRLREEVVVAAASVVVKADLVIVSGTTEIDTIATPVNMDRGGVLIMLVPIDGNLVLGTTGNIAVGDTITQNRLTVLAYSNINAKWYIADPL